VVLGNYSSIPINRGLWVPDWFQTCHRLYNFSTNLLRSQATKHYCISGPSEILVSDITHHLPAESASMVILDSYHWHMGTGACRVLPNGTMRFNAPLESGREIFFSIRQKYNFLAASSWKYQTGRHGTIAKHLINKSSRTENTSVFGRKTKSKIAVMAETARRHRLFQSVDAKMISATQ
jgi:hypothetical protein